MLTIKALKFPMIGVNPYNGKKSHNDTDLDLSSFTELILSNKATSKDVSGI